MILVKKAKGLLNKYSPWQHLFIVPNPGEYSWGFVKTFNKSLYAWMFNLWSNSIVWYY